MKKGNKVADNEDDDAVRTSVSQDRVTAPMCTEELFLRTHYTVPGLETDRWKYYNCLIPESCISDRSKFEGGGRIRTVNMTHLVVPVGLVSGLQGLQCF
jgi:hypothetical protein